MLNQFIIALMLILVAPNTWAQGSSSALDDAHPSVLKADRVVVKKEARILILMRGNRVLYRFHIALGGAPEGDKLEEGDWRTPEGRYIIDWRNPNSRFYKSLHISYPSSVDKKESAAQGVDPGGMIMIHGYPPEAKTNPDKYKDQDWTNGCIALENKDMDILWVAVDDGTPIEIHP
ncbi:YkuD domain protein [Desulfosarcina variabilis str. Montpellier]|uniref:L,D-transpeptidase family protein n=1 Tax=Desulfosarcina variabilis TaxID=2300 RepID=UPI003AFB7CA2